MYRQPKVGMIHHESRLQSSKDVLVMTASQPTIRPRTLAGANSVSIA